MIATAHVLYKAEDLWEIAQLPENRDRRLELVKGEVCEMAPSSPTHTVIAMRVGASLLAHVDAHNLGYVTGADGGFTLSPEDVRIPDAAFISKERLPALPEKLFPVAPDLAVEVVSPNDTAREVREKVALYLASGTRLVWVVYPDDQTVDVHRRNADGSMNVQTIGIDGVLDGGDVLPGFKLPVRHIFPQ